MAERLHGGGRCTGRCRRHREDRFTAAEREEVARGQAAGESCRGIAARQAGDLGAYPQADPGHIAAKLNGRPGETLGWQSPDRAPPRAGRGRAAPNAAGPYAPARAGGAATR